LQHPKRCVLFAASAWFGVRYAVDVPALGVRRSGLAMGATSACQSGMLEKCEPLERCEPISQCDKIIEAGVGACAGGGLDDDDAWMLSARGIWRRLLALDFAHVLTAGFQRGFVDGDKQRASSGAAPFGGERRVEALRSFLALVKHRATSVVILTWDDCNVVTSALETTGLLKLVDCIFDGNHLATKGGRLNAKALKMQEMMAKLCVGRDRTVLVEASEEPSPAGTDQGRPLLEPCQCVLIEGKDGMTQQDMMKICGLLAIKL